MIFVGDDWAEAHHDVCVLDEQRERLAKRRVPEGLVAQPRITSIVVSVLRRR